MNPTLKKYLSLIKTHCYAENISAIYYADDGIKITLTLDELQKIIDIESKSLNDWNLESNASKSKIVKYSRSKAIYNDIFKNEKDVIMNDIPIKWNMNTSNIIKFLGFYLNFNINKFLQYHVTKKIDNFQQLRNKLFYNKTIGANIPIDIQCKLYKSKIRMAFIFGLKIIYLRKYHCKQINSIQNKFLSTIFGAGQKMDALTLRILSGTPKLSDFIIKIKLIMYYDIFIKNKNKFTKFIKSNYNETYNIYTNITIRLNMSQIRNIKYMNIETLKLGFR